jgi:hypothetical protein
MDKVSKHTEEQALDAKISEKRVTKRYLRKKFKHSLKRTKRRDTHHRRKKLVEEDSDLGSSNKDMKLAKLEGLNPHKVVINWLLLGNSPQLFNN